MDQSYRVLIIDDDEISLHLLRHHVEKIGLLAMTALNGEEALSLLEESSQIDLILLDLAMPVMNGYEVCRAIRSNPEMADLPVIAVTARLAPESHALAIKAGVDDFIAKPMNIPQFRQVIERYLSPSE